MTDHNGADSRAAKHAQLIAAARLQHEGADDDSGNADTRVSARNPVRRLAPDSFAGYELLGEIHRGGQGVVYKALQKSTSRRVAIKVMRDGILAGPADRARFDREVQILGQLKHPNIVTIHDTGSAAGSQYFVMDYISGQPLDVHMASGPRDVAATLALFCKVCSAVNAAHLCGVIHRDLKPGNIRIDGAGEPHVLDFGLAKVATSDSDAAAMTQTGQFVGSLPWASPEQAVGAPDKIDIRTDVYSLGVILFQMLTGKFPYEVVGNMRDVLDRIIHAEPRRPRTIRRQIDDEVETIVLKCLQKERERRYQSAGELALDLERYARREPIDAKRDSAWYVFRKTARRHRIPMIIATLALFLIANTTVLLWWNLAQAQSHLTAIRDERDRARASEHEAARQARIAQAVNRFLNDDVLAALDRKVLGRDATVREALDRAGSELDAGSLADQAELEAAVRSSLASSYERLGLYADAECHLRAALELQQELGGERDSATLTARCDLAAVVTQLGRYEESRQEAEAALATAQAALGEDDPITLRLQHVLGLIAEEQKRYADAEEILRRTYEGRRRVLGENHRETAETLNVLGCAVRDLGRPAEAVEMHQRGRDIARAILGDDHPATLLYLNNLAVALDLVNQHAECEAVIREALAISNRISGPDHPDTHRLNVNLANSLWRQKKSGEAMELASYCVELSRRIFGPLHPRTLNSENNIALMYRLSHQYEPLEAHALATLAVRQPALGFEDEECMRMISLLLEAVWGQGRRDEAVDRMNQILTEGRQAGTRTEARMSLYERFARYIVNADLDDKRLAETARQCAEESVAQQPRPSIDALETLARTQHMCGLNAEALNTASLAFGRLAEIGLRGKALRRDVQLTYAEMLNANNRSGDAVNTLEEIAANLRVTSSPNDPELAQILHALGLLHVESGHADLAEAALREALQIRTTVLEDDNWRIGASASALGYALLRANRATEAEPLLFDGYERLCLAEGPDRAIRLAAARIADYHDACGDTEAAAAWREKSENPDLP